MRVLVRNQQTHRQLDLKKIKKVAQRVLFLLGQPTAELSILLVDDKKMQELNAAFRGVDKPTDVLSFPQIEFGVQDSGFRGGAKDHILGDIVINIQRAVIQAKMSCRRLYDEIYLLMIHGILHLLGYEHEGSRSKAMVMRRKEREIINAIKKVV